jgi:hypothetical protein
MQIFNYYRITKFYVFLLFITPSLIYTLYLLNGFDLPKLSVLSSEKFWIYLVEHNRTISNGLLAWPGNIDTSAIYIERFFVRLILMPFDPKLYFIIDSIFSSIFFITFISLILKRYYKDFKKYEYFILLLLAFQPIYLLKVIYFDINTVELWWGRNMVSSLAFIFFFIGMHELYFKKNITSTLFIGSILGLTHFYSFILFLGSFAFFLFFLIFKRNFNILQNAITGRNLILNFFFLIAIILVLLNTFIMQASNELFYFFERYTPSRNEVLYNELLFHELKYLLPILLTGLVIFVVAKKNVLRSLSMLLSSVTFTAILISFLFYFTFPDTINIHFRIYIIEPLFLFLVCLIFISYFEHLMKSMFIFIFAISLILPFNLYKFSSSIKIAPVTDSYSVHYYLFNSDLSECQCTIFDPQSHEFLEKLKLENNLTAEQYDQWTNALIHKKLYFK